MADPTTKKHSKGKRGKADDDTIFIGSKPVMNYVLAVVTQVNNGYKKIVLKARGKSISRAVDVAEVCRNRFVPDLKVDNIEIGTEQLTSDDDRLVNVSSIFIHLSLPS